MVRAQTTSPVSDFLEELRGPEQPHCDLGNRRHKRYEWRVSLKIELEERVEHGSRFRQVEVMTQDIGRGGFAFVHTHFVHIGTVVRAKLTLLPHQPVVMGIVRNCLHLSGRYHRVGVEFVQYLER